MDLVVNEEEAAWVRELFYKVVHEGASGYALAEMLNNRGLRTRAGAKFQSSNILRIIRHEGYTGYIITKNARSEYIPELQIIDQETFEKPMTLSADAAQRQRKTGESPIPARTRRCWRVLSTAPTAERRCPALCTQTATNWRW